ncbi:DEAD/DEAH box helicase [Erwinia pyrifoliae]|uniref:DEAD/DEAH box helicase n=1 Tax=Erwinia pyrifoliae TaxID=79967 RepID=UPI00223BD4E0|nr:DEAD/DEAH box helicase [Erwinia pyrifoliae]MCT2386840.1 hypothetical protein [Erwinia pyrifoliae]MCU8587561.1 hypothetical protein [Erwinia pyrifoliae]
MDSFNKTIGDHHEYIFDICRKISNLIQKNNETEARNTLIKLLDYHYRNELDYTPLVNHLIRNLGLYPYLRVNTSDWQDRLIYEAFKVDVGLKFPVTLHREQSLVLKKLINGTDLAISAPTSFGKSFIIDAFISIKKPTNVMIIVPTISLTDETRRRLHRKFSAEYKIITTSDVELGDKNIFIFPQERAIGYLEKINQIDILIVDEFYKASEVHDKERASVLLKAIIKLSKKATQRYFLSPNIDQINSNPFTKGMEFIKIDFNTVFLEKHDFSSEIKNDDSLKGKYLLEILNKSKGKSLVYAGTYKNIDKITDVLTKSSVNSSSNITTQFSNWLRENYSTGWKLPKLIENGVGIHNGRLHRSLSQLQVKLFEESDGLNTLVSTSSIVEGVNTNAENVIIWQSKNGSRNLKDFLYKNIIGRSGRMFKHFIGKVYLFSAPPQEEFSELDLTIPDSLITDIDEKEFSDSLTPDQIAAIISYREEMSTLLGEEKFKRLHSEGAFKSNNPSLIIQIAWDIIQNPREWERVYFLNTQKPDDWDSYLYKILKLQPGSWGIEYSKFVAYIKSASENWSKTIPQQLIGLSSNNISIDNLFELEKNLTHKLTSLLSDINVLLRELTAKNNADISSFIFKCSHAFLPPIVFQLEEYGLPRMLSKKIQLKFLLDFDKENLSVHQAIEHLKFIDSIIGLAEEINASEFERYIISNFIDGVTLQK